METNQLLINYYKKEELKKIKERQQEGLTKDEIIRLANKEYISVEEIKETLGIDEDEENKKEEMIQDKNVVDETTDIIIEDVEEEKIRDESNEIVIIENSKLEDFPNQPFNLYDEDKKKEMMESIRINGIMQPLIVRPLKNGNYQILAGHNRRNCGKEIGMNKFPCIIKNNLTDDEAMIYLVDTNLCTRDKISPMERARAYRLKYDTYKRRHIQTSVVEEVKRDNIGLARAAIIKEEKSSNGSIQRYLRLTYLIPKLQEAIEKGKIAITVGEKLSFLPNEEQKIIGQIIEDNIKINDKLAQKIKKQSEYYKRNDLENYLGEDEILDLIKSKKEIEEIRKDIITINFSREEVERYFRNQNTEDEIKKYILNSLEEKI